ncbi:MAG TPA: hypothetical protein VHQ65_12535 [Thermoanaerobaculia bacterium]|nr:hypothetical protein [Thermoanaerobaculia bacterium]
MNRRFTYEEWQADLARRKREKWARILASEPPGRAVGRRPRDPEKEQILLLLDRARLAREQATRKAADAEAPAEDPIGGTENDPPK